ncbi:MAG: hypothetical protein R3C44_25045, partial [Chloroflexota bacterium]
MTEQTPYDRRDFLRTAMLTAIGATAAGSGAAWWLKSRDTETTITVQPSPTLAPPIKENLTTMADGNVAVSNSGTNYDELLAQLAQSQAENMQLRSQVDQLTQDLSGLQTGTADSQTERETLTLQLDSANQRLTVLGGLVALYQQLDDLDPGEVIENGLTTLGERVGSLLENAPDLAAGIETGQLALADVESHLPLLDNGRQWLAAQADKVDGFYSEVEQLLRDAVERVGDFLEMLADWFEGLRRWLPFGVGEKAGGIMTALTSLIAEMPSTISGLDTNIAQPLDVWLERIDGEPALQRRLVKPLREEVIAHAQTNVARAYEVSTSFNDELATPVQSNLD